jgi:hypothetical protein
VRGPLRGLQEDEDEELGRAADAMFADEDSAPSPPSRPVPPLYEPATGAVECKEGHREDGLGEVARRYGEEEEGGAAAMGPLARGEGGGAASGVQAGQETGDEVGGRKGEEQGGGGGREGGGGHRCTGCAFCCMC